MDFPTQFCTQHSSAHSSDRSGTPSDTQGCLPHFWLSALFPHHFLEHSSTTNRLHFFTFLSPCNPALAVFWNLRSPVPSMWPHSYHHPGVFPLESSTASVTPASLLQTFLLSPSLKRWCDPSSILKMLKCRKIASSLAFWHMDLNLNLITYYLCDLGQDINLSESPHPHCKSSLGEWMRVWLDVNNHWVHEWGWMNEGVV